MSSLFTFNGIDGETGAYLLPQLPAQQIAALPLGRPLTTMLQQELADRAHQARAAYRVNADPRDLAATGWGVIFPAQSDATIRAMLVPLLELRQRQAGRRYKEFSGARGYRPNDTKTSFLKRFDVGPGSVAVDSVPYYLLIVADPATIPYGFQYELDIQYAVGRIHFDTPEEYRRYAESIVAAEQQMIRLPRRVAFFGVRAPDDAATAASADLLVRPLAETLAAVTSQSAQPARGRRLGRWKVDRLIGEPATRQSLQQLVGGSETPALLFAATHGLSFSNGSALQRRHQGALLCQDWPGPQRHQGPIPEHYYLSADSISDDAHPHGLIAFCFACFGAGTPEGDDFAATDPAASAIRRPFVAQLPQRLLAHPNGGALALIGHVDRAWGHSFQWSRKGGQTQVFFDLLSALLAGEPVGAALDWVNERHAEIATTLSQELTSVLRHGKKPDEELLALLWTASADARNYVIVGDPAARLAVAADAPAARPAAPAVGTALPAPALLDIQAAEHPAEPQLAVTASPPALESPESPAQQRERLTSTLCTLSAQLEALLRSASADITQIEVSTYSADDRGDRRLLLQSRLSLNQHERVYAGTADGDVPEAVRHLHDQQIEQALAQRAILLDSLAELAARIARILQSLSALSA